MNEEILFMKNELVSYSNKLMMGIQLDTIGPRKSRLLSTTYNHKICLYSLH